MRTLIEQANRYLEEDVDQLEKQGYRVLLPDEELRSQDYSAELLKDETYFIRPVFLKRIIGKTIREIESLRASDDYIKGIYVRKIADDEFLKMTPEEKEKESLNAWAKSGGTWE